MTITRKEEYLDKLIWYERDNRLIKGVLSNIMNKGNKRIPNSEVIEWEGKAIAVGLPKRYVNEIIQFINSDEFFKGDANE